MAVKVFIERRIKTGHEATVWEMMREMRSEALRTHGYIYGETWRSISQPRVLVTISAWASKEAWDRWAADPFRMKMEERIGQMLVRPSTTRLFEEMSGPPAVIRSK